MTDSPETTAARLNALKVADLKGLAASLGVKGANSMKKADLVAAIQQSQAPSQPRAERAERPAQPQRAQADETTSEQPADTSTSTAPVVRTRTRGRSGERQQAESGQGQQGQQAERSEQSRQQDDDDRNQRTEQPRGQQQGQGQSQREQSKKDQPKQNRPEQEQPKQEQSKKDRSKKDQNQKDQNQKDQQPKQGQQSQPEPDDDDDDEQGGSRRSRRRRGRERSARSGGRQDEPQILEDDVLVPAAGILDVLDNYAFVRTSGYLAGTDDVYLSLSLVRKFNLRRGDAVVGQVRQPREGERKEKFNPMVRIDSVNGADPDAARTRPDFAELTPIHPVERLRMTTDAGNVIGKVIDLVAPVGKGQRGLIVSSGPAGKTTVLQSIAESVTTNNPECHLMVVLVDERPEEVTDYQRSVKGEVVATTFDHPASEHVSGAELALERAKRLVELGHDVVVLLDGLTRLGRAYQHAAPAGGRTMTGGVDASALHPTKRFFGAARNIEDGGSLTILATALVETGSVLDEVIFEEFRGTGNLQLRLREEFAERQMFPAIDAQESGTRQPEPMLGDAEAATLRRTREQLAALDRDAAHATLMQLVRG